MFSSFAFQQLRKQAKEVATILDVSNRVGGIGNESKAVQWLDQPNFANESLAMQAMLKISRCPPIF